MITNYFALNIYWVHFNWACWTTLFPRTGLNLAKINQNRLIVQFGMVDILYNVHLPTVNTDDKFWLWVVNICMYKFWVKGVAHPICLLLITFCQVVNHLIDCHGRSHTTANTSSKNLQNCSLHIGNSMSCMLVMLRCISEVEVLTACLQNKKLVC